MSEKRYRVDETDSGGYKIVDQIKGRYVPFDTYKVVEANAVADLLNKQADELREAQAGAAALREIAGLWPAGLSEIDELAYDSQGKWASVSTENAPKWTHGYKRILAEIESVKQDRHTRFSTTTAGADLLNKQADELREALLNVAGWLLSYTEQNLVAKESPLFYELMMKYGKLAATTAGIREGTQQEMFDQIHPKRKALGEAK